jgi:hypothetical protein
MRVDIKKMSNIKTIGILSGLALIAGAVGLSQLKADSAKTAATEKENVESQDTANASPAPTTKPEVRVNGKKLTVQDGQTEVAIPGGTARVEVSNGATQVTTEQSEPSGDTSNQDKSSVNINLRTESDTDIRSRTRIRETSRDSDGSSFSSTSTFSSSSSKTSVKQ